MNDPILEQQSAQSLKSHSESNADFSLDDINLDGIQSLSMASFDSTLGVKSQEKSRKRKGELSGVQFLLQGNTLQNRLLWTFLPTALIPLLVASLIGFGVTQTRSRIAAAEDLQTKSILASEITLDFLEKAFETPANVASNPFILNALQVANQKVDADKLKGQPIEKLEEQFSETHLLQNDNVLNTTLKKFAETGGLAELFLTEKNGFNVAYSNPTSDFVQSDEDWWKSGQELGRWIGDPEFDESSNSVNVELVQSVLGSQGELLGIIKAGLPLSSFSGIEDLLDPAHTRFRASEQIQLLDAGTGEVMKAVTIKGHSSSRELTGGEVLGKVAQALVQVKPGADTTALAKQWQVDYSISNVSLNLLQHASSNLAEEEHPEPFYASFSSQGRHYTLSQIPGTDWVAIASVQKSEIAASANRLLLIFLGTAVVLGAVAAMVTQLLSRQLSQPLQEEVDNQRQQSEALQLQLLEFLDSIEGAAHGDLTVHAHVSSGEMGTVADFFNLIITSLRDIVGKVKQAATQVNTSVTDNEGSINQLAEGALRQSEEITRTLQSVETMTRSIQAVAQSANQAAEVSRSAETTAAAGEVAMDKTVDTILGLRATVAETAKKVKRLGESSQQISKVVALINQIAMKTNLLAVNASIEAARAGEEGQGFAVVAEEVGALAEQSANATQEIEKIVEGIQRETNAVVEAMEVGTTQVVEGTQLVEATKDSLEDILNVSRQINALLQSISEATVSQTETSTAVTHLMQEISQVSVETSTSSREVAGSLKETVAIAQRLEAAVGQFKISKGA